MKTEVKKVTEQVLNFSRKNKRNETYLYNNRLFTSGCINKEQYELNRAFIKQAPFEV